MGVKSLFRFLRKTAARCIDSISIEKLRGKHVAIDGNLLLFREYASPWLSVDHPNKHILWVIRLTRLCRHYGIVPYVVFDSPETTPAKAKERARRIIRRDRTSAVFKEEKARAGRLSDLSNTLGKVETLSLAAQADVMLKYKTEKHDTTMPPSTRVHITEVLSESGTSTKSVLADETTVLAKKLVSHLNAVLDSKSTSISAASELALLMKLADPEQDRLPISDLLELQAVTADLVDKLARRVAFPTYQDIRQAYRALRRLNVPVTLSPDRFEGECTASYLVHQGLADYVASQDSDVLVHGVPQLRGFMSLHLSRSGLGHESSIVTGLADMLLVDPRAMRAHLSLKEDIWTQERFLDFAILCGTDFSTSIGNLGIQRASDFMRKYTCIEDAFPTIRDAVVRSGRRSGFKKYNIHDSFLEDVAIARTIFTTYPLYTNPGNTIAGANEDRVHNLKELEESAAQYQALLSTTKEYEELEHSVLEQAGMGQHDVVLLEDPSLYRGVSHAKHSPFLSDSPHDHETSDLPGTGGINFSKL